MLLPCCCSGPEPMDIDEPAPPPRAKPKRKKAIPKALRAAVWKTYVGEDIGRAKCTVCGVADMSPFDFHCAHVVAEAEGGPTTLANLRPTCATCNVSMQKQNLDDFRRAYFARGGAGKKR